MNGAVAAIMLLQAANRERERQNAEKKRAQENQPKPLESPSTPIFRRVGHTVNKYVGPNQTMLFATNMESVFVCTAGLSPEEAEQRVTIAIAEYEERRLKLAAEYGQIDY